MGAGVEGLLSRLGASQIRDELEGVRSRLRQGQCGANFTPHGRHTIRECCMSWKGW